MRSEGIDTTSRAAKSVCFVTLGCAKNEVDTADMTRLLEAAGYAVVADPEAADAVVVNTCSFIQPAVEEGIDTILELLDETGSCDGGDPGERVPVIVAGCMPSRYGDALASELDEVAAFLPCAEESRIVEAIDACVFGAHAADAHNPACAPEPDRGAREAAASEPDAEERPRFAYVKISDGCDRWCSYCTIPIIRGRYHSFPLDQILDDVRREVGDGAREIVLIGQDTGLWGSDFPQPSSLAELLDALARAFPDTWFRALYTQPENVTEELLLTMARHDNVCPYLDIPLQHVDPSILAAMNRTGSREEFSRLVSLARKTVPGIALRTTLIAGFPGETEAMFDELVDFVEEEEFDYVGVFAYSREEGTRAHDMEGQIDEDEKAYRADRLRAVADAVSAGVVARRVGRALPVLVEGREEDGQLYGRAVVQAPEVDGVTYVDEGEPGRIVDVVVEDALMYDMEGSAS